MATAAQPQAKERPRSKGGRPPGRVNAATREIQEIARAYTQEALKALIHVAKKGKSEKARVMAANAILDRGWGKPKQPIEHGGEGGGPVIISVTHTVVDPAIET